MGASDKCILKGDRMLRAGEGVVKRSPHYTAGRFQSIIGYSLITTG
jgi:hypothetical protein